MEIIQDVYKQISSCLRSSLDKHSLSLSYLTEGAANVIWQLNFPPTSSLYSHNSAFVLRMRKDIPSAASMRELQLQFSQRIAPLFPHNQDLLLPVNLVKINQALIDDLNVQLRDLEIHGQRKSMRCGIYHPSFEIEPFAMILPNLGHGIGRLVEFKPKWLVQSPSAPQDAQKCRTCALNAMRRATEREVGRGDSGFCPFELLSNDDRVLARALSQIWADSETLERFVESFKLKVQPALLHLQELQLQENSVGLNDFQNPQGKDFSVAMALRDCSIVLKAVVLTQADELEGNDSSSIVDISLVKLLDLDLKQAGGGKVERWAQTELDLIHGGWYTAEQHSDMHCVWNCVAASNLSTDT